MDAALCREQLDQLLTQEASALSLLQTLLDREHESLAASDIDALERAGAARQACVGDLLRIEDERQSLCRLMNYSADAQGIDKLLTWCDTSQQLRRRWNKTLELATTCRRLNNRNGVVVAAKLKRVEGLLAVVTGRNKKGAVYGRKGIEHLSGGHSLGQA